MLDDSVPLSTVVHHEPAGILRDAGRYDVAIEEYRTTLKLNPQFMPLMEMGTNSGARPCSCWTMLP